MRSNVLAWCGALRRFVFRRKPVCSRIYIEHYSFVDLPPEQRKQPSETANLPWPLQERFSAFPRPQCENETQVDQILDILDRFCLIQYSYDFTRVAGNTCEIIHSSIEVKFREPSTRSANLLSDPLLGRLAARLCPSAAGTITLSFSFFYNMPKHGEASTWLLLFMGEDRASQENLFSVESYHRVDFNGDHTLPLQAVKARLLDGAPGVPETQISDQQFMTLLLMLLLGHELRGYDRCHKRHFAGYFSNAAHDDTFYR